MNYLKYIFFLLILASCHKDDPFIYAKTDNNGNIIGGDTTQGILKQDITVSDGTDSICSQTLFLKTPKYRGCNGNVKVTIYPNPVKANENLYLKITSDRPIYSFNLGSAALYYFTVGYEGHNQTTIIQDITPHKLPYSSSYEIYLATADSCVYHGLYNLARE
jgi:hypothetical protein